MTANAAQIAADAYPPAESPGPSTSKDATAAAKPPPAAPLEKLLRFALSTAFTLWWCKRWWRALVTPYQIANFLLLLSLHRLSNGRPAAAAHARGVFTDLAMPFAVCWRTHLTLREQAIRLILSLGTATSYVYAYGPFCAVMVTAFVTPASTLWSFAHMVHGGLLGPASVVGLVVGTLAFHFGYQLVISTLLHRYFSHRAFAASRPLNFVLALVAVAAGQRGPLWWASTHRRHHQLCDRDGDPHSPAAVPSEHALLPWLHAHILWMTRRENFGIRPDLIGDWLQARARAIRRAIRRCAIRRRAILGRPPPPSRRSARPSCC